MKKNARKRRRVDARARRESDANARVTRATRTENESDERRRRLDAFVGATRDAMVKTRVTCYFPVENAREAKLGAFAVWYVDVDVEATDTKTDVRKAIALATGAKFSRLKIRLGMFNELLAFEDGRYGAVLKVGSCGASAATRDERLLTAHELNDLGAGSASDLPDWDPSKYDGRYGWVQEVKEHWK